MLNFTAFSGVFLAPGPPGANMAPRGPWTQNDAADKVLIRLCQGN